MAGVPRRRRGAPGLPWWSVSMAAASAAAAAATVAVAAAAAPSAGAPAATAAAVWRDRAAAAAPWPATRPAAAPAAGVAAGAERQVADAPVATACRATLTIQFFYTQLRVFVDDTLLYEKPPTNTDVTHNITATLPVGARIGLSGHHDVAPDTHAAAVRVGWVNAGALPAGAPLLTGPAWRGAPVDEAFALTFGGGGSGGVDPPAWAPTVDVSDAVAAPFAATAPAGARHVAVPPPWTVDGVPAPRFHVAFQSPPIPAGACVVQTPPPLPPPLLRHGQRRGPAVRWAAQRGWQQHCYRRRGGVGARIAAAAE